MVDAVRNNEAESRYELAVEGQTAFAAYDLRGDVVAFTHTVVPKVLEGKGIAGRLIKETLADVRASGRKIVPLCSFVAAYVQRHPEEADLVAD